MKNTAIVVILILIVAAAGSILFWAFSFGEAVPVNVAEVQLSAVRSSISTNGKIEAERTFEIRAPFAGTCRADRIHAGDSFKAGQPIVTVTDPGLQSELASAQSELDSAEADLQNVRRGPSKEEVDQISAEITRARSELDNAEKVLESNEWLLQREAISRYEVEQSRREVTRLRQTLNAAVTRKENIEKRFTDADRKRTASRVEAARLRVQLAENRLERSIVRAPADGVLFHFELKPGAYLNSGDLIGLFADLSKLRARAFVDEPDLGHVSKGAEVTIRWDAHPQEAWKGTVFHIPSEVVTRGTRSVAEVLCTLDGPSDGLLPNVSVDVEITTARGPEVRTLPRTAVLLEGKDHFVWCVQNGLATKRLIETGRGTASVIEVTNGLKVGDRVIIPGEAPISEGMKVRVAGK